MQEIPIEQIVEKANEFKSQGKKWHFHMLTPDCMFNEKTDKHAFVLENISDSQIFFYYSNERRMKEGKQLVEMLHQIKVQDEGTDSHQENEQLREILQRAKELNFKGISWHHHMFFPNCRYNKHQGKWCLVMEDKEQNKAIESITQHEHKQDLQKVEKLFYEQKS